jgi:hypothetical protein
MVTMEVLMRSTRTGGIPRSNRPTLEIKIEDTIEHLRELQGLGSDSDAVEIEDFITFLEGLPERRK